jgi:hypothetical protein
VFAVDVQVGRGNALCGPSSIYFSELVSGDGGVGGIIHGNHYMTVVVAVEPSGLQACHARVYASALPTN